MKIAICFFGFIGKMKRFHSRRFYECSDIDMSIPRRHFKHFVLEQNSEHEIDTYIHTSSTEYKDDLLNFYHPKDYLIEENPFKNTVTNFKNNVEECEEQRRIYALASRLYSNKVVVDLMNKSNIKYDFVLLVRHDLVFFEPLLFNQFDGNYFYVANNRVDKKFPDPKVRIPDWVFGSGQELMTEFSKAYDDLDAIHKYNISCKQSPSFQHGACLYQLLKMTPDFSKVKYMLDMYNDHILCKYLYVHEHDHPERFSRNPKTLLYKVDKLKITGAEYPAL